MQPVTCSLCNGSGEDSADSSQECPECGGYGEHPEYTQFSRSLQYGTPCVVVVDFRAQPYAVRLWADLINARYYVGGEFCYVVDFQIDGERGVGPELYTERALNASFRTPQYVG